MFQIFHTASCALKNITFTCSNTFWMFWWYDTLSCRVFLVCFLAPDNPPPPLQAEWQRAPSSCHLAWPWQRSTWLQAAYTFLLLWICLRHWHSISAGMSCVQTLKGNATVCYRSFELAVNTCQDTSLLFLLAILTKAARNNGGSYSTARPPCPTANLSAGSLVYFFIKEKHSPLQQHIQIPLE